MANQRKNNSSIKNNASSRKAKKTDEKILFPEDSEGKNEQYTKSSKKNLVKESKENLSISQGNYISNTISFDKPIYLQMAIENIYSVFSKGLILPNKYSGDNAFPDVQSLIPTGLILSNGILGDTKNDLLLEIILTAEEIAKLLLKGNIAVQKFPLPVSRINRIYVNSEEIKSSIVIMSSINDGGIIPEELISTIPTNISRFEIPNVEDELINGIDEKIKLYDRILGVFAYLSNYSILTSKRTNFFKTLPDHFFYALQAINGNLDIAITKNDRATNFYKQLFNVKEGDNPIFSWLITRLNKGGNFHDEDVLNFANILATSINDKNFLKDLKPILTSLNKSLERKTAIKNIPLLSDSDKFYVYLFAILRQYGNLNTEDKSISRVDLPEFIHPSYGEYTFACLGYFYGYSALRNYEEKIAIEDKIFGDYILQKRVPIKFELNYLFNLNVIESVYQYVFNDKISNETFEYINNQSVATSSKSAVTIKLNKNYSEEKIEILGKWIYYIKKNTLIDILEEQLAKIENDIPALSQLGLLCYRNKLSWNFSDFNTIFSNKSKIAYIIVFKKEDLLNAVKKQILQTEEVLNALSIDFQHNEF